MNVSSKAFKYAEALLDVVGGAAPGDAARTAAELEELQHLIEGHQELHETLHSPAIPFSAKRAIVERVGSAGGISRPLINLVLVLLENGRMRLFDEVVEAYRAVMDRRSGVVTVDISSARPLADDQRGRLERVLRETTSREVKCRFHVDEQLVGGMKMQIGSKVFDGTVSTRLEQIRSAIVGAR